MPQFAGSINQYPGRASLTWYAVADHRGVRCAVPRCRVRGGSGDRPITCARRAVHLDQRVVCDRARRPLDAGRLLVARAGGDPDALIQLGGIGIMTVTTFIVVQFNRSGSLRQRKVDRGDARRRRGRRPAADPPQRARDDRSRASSSASRCWRPTTTRTTTASPELGVWDSRAARRPGTRCSTASRRFATRASPCTTRASCRSPTASSSTDDRPAGRRWRARLPGRDRPLEVPQTPRRARPLGPVAAAHQDHADRHRRLAGRSASSASSRSSGTDGVLADDPIPTSASIKAAFHSLTCRTAGFNTVEIAELTNAMLFISVLLMMIGAGPCSTGGRLQGHDRRDHRAARVGDLPGYTRVNLFRRTLPMARASNARWRPRCSSSASAGVALTSLLGDRAVGRGPPRARRGFSSRRCSK